MRRRKPRKGELNHEISRIVTKTFNEVGDTLRALPIIRSRLASLSKRWSVRETIVEWDTELVPCNGKWKPGRMRSFVDMLRITAYRIRPNRTIAEHKVNLVHWPVTPSNLPPNETNPQIHTVVDDPYHLLSVHKTDEKIVRKRK